MKLLLFDIDLTLINSAGAGRRAMTIAFEQLFRTKNGLDSVNFAGRTDRAIFKDALFLHDLEWQQIKEDDFKRLYFDILKSEIKKPDNGKHIEPGILDLLEYLNNREDMTLALLTGNWLQGARIKLEHFQLMHYFQFGAFADDSGIRNELPSVAAQRYFEKTSREILPEDIVVIGDTPLDVACAKAFNAKSIAVATGFFSFEELEKAQPNFLLPDLSDIKTFMSMVNPR